MIKEEVTLKRLLPETNGKLTAQVQARLEASADLPALKERLQGLKRITWGSVLAEVGEKVSDLLDFNLLDALTWTWKKYEVLAEYGDPEKHPPGETALVALAEHSVRSEHHPYVEILISEQAVAKIVFDVIVRVQVKGFQLKISDGRIKAVQSGTLEGKVTVALGVVALLDEKLPPFVLPGSIGLGEGIDLRE